MRIYSVLLVARSIVLLGLLFNTACVQAATKEQCINLLGAGIYNEFLETYCHFNGGVKEKLKSMYTGSDCRRIVVQEEVNQTIREVVEDSRNRFKSMGEKSFCSGNKKAYFDLVDTKEALPVAKKGEDYGVVRKNMISSGWKPYHSANADKCNGDPRCNGRPEMESCAGTGMANCKFLWQKNGKTIGICTVGETAVFDNICSN